MSFQQHRLNLLSDLKLNDESRCYGSIANAKKKKQIKLRVLVRCCRDQTFSIKTYLFGNIKTYPVNECFLFVITKLTFHLVYSTFYMVY